VIEKLLELMNLLRDVNEMLKSMTKLARAHGVEVYVIGGCVKFSEDFKCFSDMCIFTTRDSSLRVHADGSVDKVVKTSTEIVKASRGEFEDAVAQYKDRVYKAVKSLRELREILKVATATVRLMS
jgi:hypothetical protein